MFPSRACLKVYVRRYKSGFGFSPAVLAGIVKKTKDMEEYRCHEVLIMDEMKFGAGCNSFLRGLKEWEFQMWRGSDFD